MNEQNFYPNLEYNRANRKRFFTLMILLVACLGLVVGLMVTIEQYIFAIFFAIIILMALVLIPSAIKSHPVKPNVPLITVNNKDITAQGKTYKAQDIDFVHVTVILSPVSKLNSENKEYAQKMASKMPEEMMLGNVDIRLKKGLAKRGEEVIYTTCEDCIGALTAILGAGVKHYKIIFNLKKINEPAQFSITKSETKKQTLTDVSQKERMKQLI